jgi:hypothetical protein
MTRWLHGLLGLTLVATVSAGCNTTSCGKGTKQMQDPTSGNTFCVPADAPGPENCTDNSDAGTAIIAGICVGDIICGPNTIKVPRNDGSGTYYCQGTGQGAQTCSNTPMPGNICVSGTIRDFDSFMPIDASATVYIAIYDPLDFLAHGSSATPLVQKELMGPNFLFDNVPLPSLQLIALAVTDSKMTPPPSPVLSLAGTGLQGAAGGSYTLDGYAIPLADVANWKSEGGVDYDSMGAYAGFFFSDASKAMQDDFSQYETMPVSGVQIVQVVNGMPQTQALARYFSPSRAHVDPALTATGALGGAIVPIGVLSAFSGMGPGGMKWEAKPGGSAAHVVFVDRFHPGM